MEYQNIHISDLQNYDSFKQKYKQGDYASALSILSQDSLESKKNDSNAINKILRKMLLEQQIVYENIDDTLKDYLHKFDFGLSGYKLIGKYDPNEEYQTNNVVKFNGDYYYLSIKFEDIKLPSPPSYPWIKIVSDGQDGMINLTIKGLFNISTNYTVNSVVYDKDTENFYWCKKASMGNPITNNEFWCPLMQIEKQQMKISKIDNLENNDIWLEEI